MLAFVGFVLVRAGPGVFLEWRQLAGLRTVSVFFALGLVGAVLLARQFIWLPWPEGRAPLRARHRLGGLLAFLPLVLVGLVVAGDAALWAEVFRARPAQLIPMVATIVLRVVGLGLGPVLVWLAVGVELKTKPTFSWRAFVEEQGRALGSTLRDWAPLLFILSAYAWMDAVIGGKVGDGRDAWMASADRWLFGGADPLELLEPLISRPLSEWLAFSYSFYAVLFPLVLGAVLMRGGPVALRESAFVLGGALLIGYVSYSLIPVKGPVLSRTFSVSLELYLLASVKEAMMDATRITWDCFPSMHTCCSVVLGWSAFRHARALFWWLLPIVASIPFACVYLRYHYVVDVLAGLALAVVLIVATRRLRRA